MKSPPWTVEGFTSFDSVASASFIMFKMAAGGGSLGR